MDDVPIKPIVLALLRQTRRDEQAMVAGLTDAERSAAGAPEHWSAKDIVVHMAAWKQRHAQKLVAALRGEIPPMWTDMELVDRLNAETFAAWQHCSWREVLDQAERAFVALYTQVERMVEEELADPNRFAWQNGEPLWEETLGNGVWHPYTHLTEFYRRRGDTERATGLHEALVGALTEFGSPPKLRGNATYNLVCVYATTGQPGKALAMLPEAQQLNPNLMQWSQNDPDLESLRGEPAFQALYTEVAPAVRSSDLISPHELRKQQEGAAAPVVIDVRGASEHAAGHVRGAIHIPLSQLVQALDQIPHDHSVITYCNMHQRGQSRSERAAAFLQEHGYQVRALDGGYPAWTAADLPAEAAAKV
jgi:rhodanese-related sulfurtransferase